MKEGEAVSEQKAGKEEIFYQGCRCMGQGECEFCTTDWNGFGDSPSVVKARRDMVRAFNKYKPERTHMTWREIKKQVESQGVKDDDDIRYIDIPGFDEKIRCTPIPVFLKDRPSWEITQ